MKFEFIENHKRDFSVAKMAKLLKVTRSAYYRWRTSNRSEHDKYDDILLVEISKAFHENKRRYGSPRIYRELKKVGFSCSKKRVARIMRENDIKAGKKKRFKAVSKVNLNNQVVPNVLNRQFSVDVQNKYWASDITYIWTLQGWYYLCVVIDLYSRKVVGWSMDSRMETALVMSALKMAITHRDPKAGLTFHSDRGSQYTSKEFKEKLLKEQMIQSMSRRGNCWDNACCESFFASLKKEEVYTKKYKTREEARRSIFEYIEVYYNRKRSHSLLDFLSPVEYELNMQKENA